MREVFGSRELQACVSFGDSNLLGKLPFVPTNLNQSKKKLAMFCCGWRWVQVECFRKSQQVLGSQSCLCLFHPRSHGGAESSISPVFVCNQISSAAISYCLAKVKELACICEIYPSFIASELMAVEAIEWVDIQIIIQTFCKEVYETLSSLFDLLFLGVKIMNAEKLCWHKLCARPNRMTSRIYI